MSKELNKPRLSTKNQGFQTTFIGHPFHTQTPRRQMITNYSLHHGTIGNLTYAEGLIAPDHKKCGQKKPPVTIS